MPTCKYCKCEKPNREMATWGGTPTETCLDCKASRKKARDAAKGTPLEVPAAAPAAITSEHGFKIEVAPSLGFTATIDGDNLVISQVNSSRENDDDNVTLTREEARGLFVALGKWAGA